MRLFSLTLIVLLSLACAADPEPAADAPAPAVPPVTAEPEWDSPRTRELAARACFDCHSNEVDYPWYSKIAPMSWAVQRHVDNGRGKVNYSEWDQPQDDADESAETVREGEMPPAYYTLLANSDAKLTDAEKQELIDGFEATPGTSNGD